MSHIKKTVLKDLLTRLQGVKFNQDNSYSFLVREINSDINKEIIKEDLGDLKKVFKLPSPAKREKIKKFTSSMIIHMAKQCECKIDKCTKYYRVEKPILIDRDNVDTVDARYSYESTSGFYQFFNLDN